jgi:hypothetical protein
MNPISLVDLANLFDAAVAAEPNRLPHLLEKLPPADRGRIEKTLAGLLACPEDARMLRLPLTDTDMVDFDFPVEAGN